MDAVEVQTRILEQTRPIYALIAKIYARSGAVIMLDVEGDPVALFGALPDDARLTVENLQRLADAVTHRILNHYDGLTLNQTSTPAATPPPDHQSIR